MAQHPLTGGMHSPHPPLGDAPAAPPHHRIRQMHPPLAMRPQFAVSDPKTPHPYPDYHQPYHMFPMHSPPQQMLWF
jgi:hypothetical protein